MNRRELLTRGTVAAMGAAALPLAAETRTVKARRPNILVFLTDDQGQWLEEAAGNSEVQTPNLLRLAKRGVRMRNAYCTTPVCSPARASFFTGRMPSQHGIHDWLDEQPAGADFNWLEGQTLISELLKKAGYRTGLVGKWHCGQDHIPQRGFDEWFSFWQGQYPHAGVQTLNDNGRHTTPDGVQSEIFAAHAVQFLRDHHAKHHEQPFFLFVGFTDTHSPHEQAPAPMVAKYKDATFRDIPKEKALPVHGRALHTVNSDPVKERHTKTEYYAAASQIDHCVGTILDELAASGELDHTMVVYTGDHGLNAGHHGLWEKGNATVPQNFLEESIRVCCTWSWPKGGVKQGLTSDLPGNQTDVFMTVLDVAGALPNAAEAKSINSPGKSYLPVLRGEPVDDWHDGMINEYGNARMMVRNGYKLILRYPFRGKTYPHELYDLRADPRETTNLYPTADDVQKVAIASMTKEIDDFFAVYTVPGKSGLEMESQPIATKANPWLQPA